MSQSFGKISSGQEATLYTLKAGNVQLDVTDFGATWVNLIFEGTDILLCYNDAGQYKRSSSYFGATVGRVANRIGGASFSLNGKAYKLEANEGTNSLHGGPHGYDKRIWQTSGVSDDIRRLRPQLYSERYTQRCCRSVLTVDGYMHENIHDHAGASALYT